MLILPCIYKWLDHTSSPGVKTEAEIGPAAFLGISKLLVRFRGVWLGWPQGFRAPGLDLWSYSTAVFLGQSSLCVFSQVPYRDRRCPIWGCPEMWCTLRKKCRPGAEALSQGPEKAAGSGLTHTCEILPGLLPDSRAQFWLSLSFCYRMIWGKSLSLPGPLVLHFQKCQNNLFLLSETSSNFPRNYGIVIKSSDSRARLAGFNF